MELDALFQEELVRLGIQDLPALGQDGNELLRLAVDGHERLVDLLRDDERQRVHSLVRIERLRVARKAKREGLHVLGEPGRRDEQQQCRHKQQNE